MTNLQYQTAIDALLHLHNQDPNQTVNNNLPIAEETLYANRMVEQLVVFYPQASLQLKTAAFAHHLKRWEIKRNLYPMDKQGYFQWRRHVAKHQLEQTIGALQEAGVSEDECNEIIGMLKKENLKTNPLAQVIEDVACIVFVQYYLKAFAAPHDNDKVVDIVRKTMLKMSPLAIQACGSLPLDSEVVGYINQAVALLPPEKE